ncbi:dsrm domain protein [Ceratobasidium sp. AG-Ba]|nr:dsrm domain protein [Ceratobasidium sp. AG-Ba]
MTQPLINRRWNRYRPVPGQFPLDSLNNWEGSGLAKSKVDWEDLLTRGPGNIAVHTCIPLVSCRRYYVVTSDMMPKFRRVCNPRDDPRAVAAQLIHEWLHNRREFMVEYDFGGDYDNRGQYVVWVTRYSNVSQFSHVKVKAEPFRRLNMREHDCSLKVDFV